jgi:hypothetical protein
MSGEPPAPTLTVVEGGSASSWLQGVEHFLVPSSEALHEWLAAYAERQAGIWLVTWRQRPGAPFVSHWHVLDELLCFGWIDGRRRRVDERFTAQWISPRRHRCWTASYRERFERLRSTGRLQPPTLGSCSPGAAGRNLVFEAGCRSPGGPGGCHGADGLGSRGQAMVRGAGSLLQAQRVEMDRRCAAGIHARCADGHAARRLRDTTPGSPPLKSCVRATRARIALTDA